MTGSKQPIVKPGSATAEPAAGIAKLLAGRMIALGLQFVVLVVIGRALGPIQYGVLAFELAVFLYVGLVADLGLSTVGTRDVARGVAQAESHVFALRLAASVGSALIAGIVILLLPISEEQQAVGLALAVGLLFSGLNMRWYLQGREHFGAIALIDSVATAIQLVAALLLVRAPDDLVPAALVMTIGPVVGAVLSLALSIRVGLRSRMVAPTLLLLRAALPLGIAVLATQIYYGADSILIGVFRSSAEVGWYSAAYRIVLACLAVPFVTHAVALPILARLLPEDGTEVRNALTTLCRGLLVIALPVAVGTTIMAEPLVSSLFGVAFAPSAAPLAILIWSCVTVSANAPFAALLLASSRDRTYLGITVAGSVINVSANLIVIPAFGMIGAATITLATEVIVFAFIAWATRRLAVPILSEAFRRAIVPTLVMALVILPIRDSILAIPVGVAVFTLVAAATRTLPVGSFWALVSEGRRQRSRIESQRTHAGSK